jgi:hypothetical protein
MLIIIPSTAHRRNAQAPRALWRRVAGDAAALAPGACDAPPGEADINAQLCRRMWRIALVQEVAGECKPLQFPGLRRSHTAKQKITKRTNLGLKNATAAAPREGTGECPDITPAAPEQPPECHNRVSNCQNGRPYAASAPRLYPEVVASESLTPRRLSRYTTC